MKNGFYRVEYEPEVVGTYRVEISHQSKPITEHPFYVEVTDPASVRISEVHEAYAGKESYFIRKNLKIRNCHQVQIIFQFPYFLICS